MLDKWEEDITSSLVEINKLEDRNPINPDDEIAVTNALFSLIKSYAFRDEFKGAVMQVADSDIQYSRIVFPELNDPYSDRLDIRDETFIHPLGWKFEPAEYWEDEDEEPEVWESPDRPVFKEFSEPLSCEKTNKLLNRLREQSVYYQLLLETDPEKQIKNLQSLNHIEFRFMKDSSYHDLDRLTNMGMYRGGNIDHVFGHRYVNGSGHRHHVVAQNWLGPVGVLCLFDHAEKGVMDPDPSRYSVSFVSVSPSYRRQGISTQLMREAFKQCIKDQRYLARTDPSDMGREVTFDHFTTLGEKEFPQVPFLKRGEAQYLFALTKQEGFHDMPYSLRCQAVSELADKVRSMIHEIQGKHDTMFVHDYLDREELQGFIDNLREKYREKFESMDVKRSEPSP